MYKLQIDELMKERQLSPADLVNKAGISYSTAYAIQRGNAARISIEAINRVCAALDVDPGRLFKIDCSAQ
jgi:DNA-binding Xre family transcriptional regulator